MSKARKRSEKVTKQKEEFKQNIDILDQSLDPASSSSFLFLFLFFFFSSFSKPLLTHFDNKLMSKTCLSKWHVRQLISSWIIMMKKKTKVFEKFCRNKLDYDIYRIYDTKTWEKRVYQMYTCKDEMNINLEINHWKLVLKKFKEKRDWKNFALETKKKVEKGKVKWWYRWWGWG